MEKTRFQEDQPKPEAAPAAEPTATQRMQSSTNGLGLALMRKLQASGGNMDVLAMDVKVHILAEAVQALMGLVVDLSAGRLTEDGVTLVVAARVEAMTKGIDAAMRAPLLARGVKQAMNGK
jgi:hypothetical protein